MQASCRYRLYEDGRLFELMFPLHESVTSFFTQEAAKFAGGSVLELACGTGRLAVSLAKLGLNVTGLDLSPRMLQQAREHSDREHVSMRWVEGDMRMLEFDECFDLVILTGNSLCHLLDIDSIDTCLSGVRDHLTARGRFLLTVFVPAQSLLLRKSENWESFATFTDPESGEDVELMYRYEYEPGSQIKRHTLRREFPDGTSDTSQLDLKMFFPAELDALLRHNGFNILEKFGSFERDEFGPDSGQQVFICERVESERSIESSYVA